MQIVNEATSVELSAAIRGDDGSLVAPTTLKYRLDCETSGKAITAWTSLTPEAITAIRIPASSNAIQDDGQPFEDKAVTIMADEGLLTQQVEVKKYRVRNLGGIG